MKSLSQYMYDKLKITTKDKRIIVGEAISFTSSVESDSGYDELGIDKSTYLEVVDESEIESIEVIEESDFDPFK